MELRYEVHQDVLAKMPREWGYIITNGRGECIGSRFGFYQHDTCEAEAKNAIALVRHLRRVKHWILRGAPLHRRKPFQEVV